MAAWSDAARCLAIRNGLCRPASASPNPSLQCPAGIRIPRANRNSDVAGRERRYGVDRAWNRCCTIGRHIHRCACVQHNVCADRTELIGNGHVLAIAVFVAIGLLVGHLLGGPEPENRVVLALSTASRHPGVAMAIAAGTSPDEKLTIGAILLYLVVNTIISIPYVRWARARQAAAVPGTIHT